ncbi:ELO family, conserved site,ELO family [Cinara cedri]|uniref:Elongation of very long chain fatty acids protein n=1 Tax=Cinara cedri TaxID=506608 RepID=A0A5E4NBH2_9HEMI|nr:ELO family, conserved site,ELO family [Cinara cedri]
MSALLDHVQGGVQWIHDNSHPLTKDLWFMGSIWPVTITLVLYLSFVLKIGPELMKSRKPLNVDIYIKIYNIIQILFSLYLLREAFRLLWLRFDYRFFCVEMNKDPDVAKEQVFTVWLFLMSRLLDLLDTIFFVLRKKHNQITFLHVYHHAIVVSLAWFIINFYPGGQGAFFGTVNSFVHVIMYSYYLLTIINPEYKKAWWKKYLTILQLVQFVITGLHALLSVMEPDCDFPKFMMYLGISQDIFMFILFYDFYKKTYSTPKKNKQS